MNKSEKLKGVRKMTPNEISDYILEKVPCELCPAIVDCYALDDASEEIFLEACRNWSYEWALRREQDRRLNGNENHG